MTGTFDIMAFTLLLPLLGALLIGLAGKQWSKGAAAFTGSASVGLSFLVVLASIIKFHADPGASARSVDLWNWGSIQGVKGSIDIAFGLYIDPLSLTLMSVVTGVGFLIHWFSTEYMEHDSDYSRYFCLLNLFVGAMTMLVLANNFVTLIIGWGGVGFASFALIGFWREKPSAAVAAKKAFVMNVIGDVGLMVAVFILVTKTGVVDYQTMFTKTVTDLKVAPSSHEWLVWVVLGLMLGAYAKSAQLPLHTWLPDAMEGPTPVSALIHAATMVTAGVYLLVRCHSLLELVPNLMSVIAVMGALTALFAACCAMVQNDLKRVLAYSTMSQLGYMFLAVGVGAYGAAVFHLVTHAFFKALLFLTAGIVIHAAHGEQDMRRLGGLSKDIPYTTFMFGVGGAALAGVPLTSGFFSKEAILHAAGENPLGGFLFGVGALVALMTAFYTGRAFFLTFYGNPKVSHPHLPGGPTTLACSVLTVLALIAGYFYEELSNWFGGEPGFVIHPGVLSPAAIGISVMVLVCIGVAWSLYGQDKPDTLGRNSTFYNFARSGFGVDHAYGQIAGGFNLLGRLAGKALDKLLSDLAPALVGQSFTTSGGLMRETQSGQLRQYMISILVSVAVLLIYSLVIGGKV